VILGVLVEDADEDLLRLRVVLAALVRHARVVLGLQELPALLVVGPLEGLGRLCAGRVGPVVGVVVLAEHLDAVVEGLVRLFGQHVALAVLGQVGAALAVRSSAGAAARAATENHAGPEGQHTQRQSRSFMVACLRVSAVTCPCLALGSRLGRLLGLALGLAFGLRPDGLVGVSLELARVDRDRLAVVGERLRRSSRPEFTRDAVPRNSSIMWNSPG